MIVTAKLLLLLLLPLAAVCKTANKDDAAIIKTKTDWRLSKQSNGGNYHLKVPAIFLALSIYFFSCRKSDSS
jgi:hypothetical protein